MSIKMVRIDKDKSTFPKEIYECDICNKEYELTYIHKSTIFCPDCLARIKYLLKED